MADNPLEGRSILVIEDEYFAAADLQRELVRAGGVVIGPAPSLEKALELIGSAARIDAAILDINLGGEMVYSAAQALVDRGVPFMFSTGYDHSEIPAQFVNAPRHEKPIGSDKLCQALATIISTNESDESDAAN